MNIEGVVGLFPLTQLDARYIGYYINDRGEVFSTKQYRKPTKMAGSGTGNSRTYTIGIGRNRSKTESGWQLLQRAKQHHQWAAETSSKAMTVEPAQQQATAELGLQAKGFVIAQVQNGQLVFGSKPKIHLSESSVKTEVERLAHKSPGTQIVYLQIKGGAIAEGMRWL